MGAGERGLLCDAHIGTHIGTHIRTHIGTHIRTHAHIPCTRRASETYKRLLAAARSAEGRSARPIGNTNEPGAALPPRGLIAPRLRTCW